MTYLATHSHYPPPTAAILTRFYAKIDHIVALQRIPGHPHWLGELKRWQLANTTDCESCQASRPRQACVFGDAQMSCRACRYRQHSGASSPTATSKTCSRKLRFLFDMTKDEFFSDYDQFVSIYHAPSKPAWDYGATEDVTETIVRNTTPNRMIEIPQPKMMSKLDMLNPDFLFTPHCPSYVPYVETHDTRQDQYQPETCARPLPSTAVIEMDDSDDERLEAGGTSNTMGTSEQPITVDSRSPSPETAWPRPCTQTPPVHWIPASSSSRTFSVVPAPPSSALLYLPSTRTHAVSSSSLASWNEARSIPDMASLPLPPHPPPNARRPTPSIRFPPMDFLASPATSSHFFGSSQSSPASFPASLCFPSPSKGDALPTRPSPLFLPSPSPSPPLPENILLRDLLQAPKIAGHGQSTPTPVVNASNAVPQQIQWQPTYVTSPDSERSPFAWEHPVSPPHNTGTIGGCLRFFVDASVAYRKPDVPCDDDNFKKYRDWVEKTRRSCNSRLILPELGQSHTDVPTEEDIFCKKLGQLVVQMDRHLCNPSGCRYVAKIPMECFEREKKRVKQGESLLLHRW
ncbi:hypothetical protein C8F01DRAFT_1150949 [Mycena amicta]|nr:hypothetical protein C8F01DRAFT_1150949 [Mycena amicta]